MNERQNPFPDTMEGQEQDNFRGSTHDKMNSKPILEMKNPQYMISPGNYFLSQQGFSFLSPSPLKFNMNYADESCQFLQNFSESNVLMNHPFKISNIISFDQSPSKRHTISPSEKNIPSICLSKISFDQIGRDSKKNSKGLRNLSKMVYQIVMKLKKTTYKQVADKLIEMLNCGEFGPVEEFLNKKKDQQNIKRRVYDALNVLISAQIIQKKDKFVYTNPNLVEETNNFDDLIPNVDISALELQIDKKKCSIKEKSEIIENLKHKNFAVQSLLKRNRNKKFQRKQKIYLPMIGTIFINPKNSIEFNQNHQKVAMKADEITAIGDIDMLLRIGVQIQDHNIEEVMDIEERQLPKELENITPQQLFAKNLKNKINPMLSPNKKSKVLEPASA